MKRPLTIPLLLASAALAYSVVCVVATIVLGRL